MCLIVLKPAGKAIPHDLLIAAAGLDPDGWGVMGHDATGDLVGQERTWRPAEVSFL